MPTRSAGVAAVLWSCFCITSAASPAFVISSSRAPSLLHGRSATPQTDSQQLGSVPVKRGGAVGLHTARAIALGFYI